MKVKGMISYLKYLTLAVVMGSLFFFSGCGDDDDVPTQTIWEIVSVDDRTTILAAQLEAGGLDATLDAPGQLTLFAPSNAAMNSLLGTLGFDSPEDFDLIRPDVIASVLTYHVLASKQNFDQLTGSVATLQGENITVVAAGGTKTISTGATSPSGFTVRDIQATNGVVHIIDVVMVPPTVGGVIVQTLGTVAQPLLLAATFSTLGDAIKKADEFAAGAGVPTLVSILIQAKTSDAERYTVFAPPNAVFQQAQITTATFTGQQWYGIIAHHVGIGLLANASDFTAGQTIPVASGGSLTVLTTAAPPNPAAGITTGIVLDSNGNLQPNGQVAVLNAAQGSNGTVHAFAGVLSPQ